jgi:hypothetical protein
MAMGITTGIWISAQVRICDRAFIPATVVRRGDPDAGTVLLKLNRFEAGVTVYTQTSSSGDEPMWSRGTGPNPVTEAEADAYIERQVKYDPDVWVLEIEDRRGQYKMDGKIV